MSFATLYIISVRCFTLGFAQDASYYQRQKFLVVCTW